jgi:hypothetical protein
VPLLDILIGWRLHRLPGKLDHVILLVHLVLPLELVLSLDPILVGQGLIPRWQSDLGFLLLGRLVCSEEGLKLLAVLFLFEGTLFVVDGLEEVDLLSIVGGGVGVVFHDALDGVWVLKGRLVLGILKRESLG